MKHLSPQGACRRLWPCLILVIAASLGWHATAIGALPDFDAFETVLLQNVRNGFVDYDGIARDERFDRFIDQLAGSPPSVIDEPGDRMALYLNAYNALAIKGILDGGSPDSLRGRRKFFRKQKYELLGEETTLEALEHERIIPLGDARVHFAIVCASMSCPRLSSRAYQARKINVQLHDAARRFINDPTRNRFDLERRIAFISKIFDWYADDFVKSGGSAQRYLARFVEDAEVQEALRRDEFELRYIEYDWSLNGYFSEAKD